MFLKTEFNLCQYLGVSCKKNDELKKKDQNKGSQENESAGIPCLPHYCETKVIYRMVGGRKKHYCMHSSTQMKNQVVCPA